MIILVTGAAGFIGSHIATALLEQNHTVIGIDNFDPYYSVQLKKDRLRNLKVYSNLCWYDLDIREEEALQALFSKHAIEVVIHLAAQAGVRDSIQNPKHYLENNYAGFLNMLETVRRHPVQHFLFASSSSVYGGSRALPFHENVNTDHPLSLYAASKKANELMAHSYAHLYGIPCTGLRFFSVYGPWGRPDMALFLFVDAIQKGEPITLFNQGNMLRDFTYVGDVVQSVLGLIEHAPVCDATWSPQTPETAISGFAPYQLFNVGGSKPVKLLEFVREIECALNKKAVINFLPMQPGDASASHCDASRLVKTLNYLPSTSIQFGIQQFVAWHQQYFLKAA
jgi:UDP-glucuronate 4-epimerase